MRVDLRDVAGTAGFQLQHRLRLADLDIATSAIVIDRAHVRPGIADRVRKPAQLSWPVAQIDCDPIEAPNFRQTVPDNPIEQSDIDVASAYDDYDSLAAKLLSDLDRARQRRRARALRQQLHPF